MKALERKLAECLREMEDGSRGDGEASFKRCLDDRPLLEPYLRFALSLRPAKLPEPSPRGLEAGHRLLLDRLAEPVPRGRFPWRPATPVFRIAAGLAALLLLMAGATGITAAVGGGDFVDDVLNALHLRSGPPNPFPTPNAQEGADNADDGIDNAAEESQPGQEQAADEAFDGSGNAEGADGAADGGLEEAEEQVPEVVPLPSDTPSAESTPVPTVTPIPEELPLPNGVPIPEGTAVPPTTPVPEEIPIPEAYEEVVPEPQSAPVPEITPTEAGAQCPDDLCPQSPGR